jgi:hypothetical protein
MMAGPIDQATIFRRPARVLRRIRIAAAIALAWLARAVAPTRGPDVLTRYHRMTWGRERRAAATGSCAPSPILLAEARAQVADTQLRRIVEAIKGRGLLPGEVLTVEAATATSLRDRVGFHCAHPFGDGRFFVEVSPDLYVDLAGFMAPPRALPTPTTQGPAS